MATILTIEDEDNLRYSIRQTLAKAGHEVHEAERVEPAWELTRRREYDVVLTDINLHGENGIDLVRRLRDDGFEGVIVVMTAYGSIETAVQAIKAGADDYLQKPLSLEELSIQIERLLSAREARTRLRLYQRLERTTDGDQEILGESKAWREVVAVSERLAGLPIPEGPRASAPAGGAMPVILLLGETGSGKGLLARHIHRRSPEVGKGSSHAAPFVHINCAALPPTLVESELFGHERGAFTDARSPREGLFEMADGGTVFLDEIADMPLDLQGKLLSVVETGLIRRVGGSRERFVRARIIAATNQDLARRVEDGRFRQDLYYRLSAFTIRIPPLRERGDDAVLLAERTLARYAKLYGRGPKTLTEAAKDVIRGHPWPGNVREVINVMQHAAMLCDSAQVTPASLGVGPASMRATRIPRDERAARGSTTGDLRFDFTSGRHTAEEVEKALIVQALEHTHGNVSKAAKLIGMQRSSFRYRVERYGLESLVREIAKR